jgi:hypothetical protein
VVATCVPCPSRLARICCSSGRISLKRSVMTLSRNPCRETELRPQWFKQIPYIILLKNNENFPPLSFTFAEPTPIPSPSTCGPGRPAVSYTIRSPAFAGAMVTKIRSLLVDSSHAAPDQPSAQVHAPPARGQETVPAGFGVPGMTRPGWLGATGAVYDAPWKPDARDQSPSQ